MGQVILMPVAVEPIERRTEQLNLRLRPQERRLLQQEAERRGYRKAAEFARDALVSILPRSAP